MKLKEGCIFQEKTLKYFLISKPGVPIVINLFGIGYKNISSDRCKSKDGDY